MPLSEAQVLEIVYPKAAGFRGRRFTQDTPVLPDVWILFGTQPGQFHDLLLTPYNRSSVEKLFCALRTRTERETRGKAGAGREFRLSYNETHVIFRTDYAGLIRILLPISAWWAKQFQMTPAAMIASLNGLYEQSDLVESLTDPARISKNKKLALLTQSVLDMVRIVGCIGLAQDQSSPLESCVLDTATLQRAIRCIQQLLTKVEVYKPPAPGEPPPLWNVFSDREVMGAIYRSRLAVKADAAVKLFQISATDICWAVIDSGIDATHPAFRVEPGEALPQSGSFDARTRVEKTLDFTRLLELTSLTISGGETHASAIDSVTGEQRERISRDLNPRLRKGQPLDWTVLEPALDVPHVQGPGLYYAPKADHGTHVAGILAANWPANDPPLIGMCPDMRLYDLRVTDDNGRAKESVILAALQYTRYLNANKGRMVVHGANLSLSLLHNVKSFACGRTPVCEESNRLVGAGIVVVAAAGNSGMGDEGVGVANDYRAISITDPGNAEEVITVGATHNSMPHQFGVSYFSSRGPTGDGRMKPDLVAPGEQILSATPGEGSAVLDGTSMAAPHVSGAAALLMARHPELRGDPRRIKEILRTTATDLGRERSFQGAGLLDILRALQSV